MTSRLSDRDSPPWDPPAMATFEVLRGASASALKIQLPDQAAVLAENDALVSKTSNESFFLQTLRCRGGTGEVLVAPQELGDIAAVQLGGAVQGILVTEGAFLCAEESVHIQTRMQSATQGLFGGSGFFLMRCSGRGSVAFGCTGSCIKYQLQPGECRVVDNGHLVAWADTVNYSVGMASNSLFGTMASGEGLMCTFTGPGPVWIQTHKASSKDREGSKAKSQAGAGNLIGACVVFFIFVVFLLMVIVAVSQGSSIPESRSHRRYIS
eukprot:Skav225414  [mRNA]  locus=scaffold2656:773536:777833:- [translate_table: standard]